MDIERRTVPGWVEAHITMKGGLNQYGQPNFRVIWGGNRTYLVGGMFKETLVVKDDTGSERTIVTSVPNLKTMLKYNPHRWHLERWRGSEYYGNSEEWYRNSWDEESQLHVMGDYPANGDYEHVFYLAQCSHMKPGDKEWCQNCRVTDGEYIPLEPNIHVLDMQIYSLLKSEDVSKVAEMGALFFREQYKRQIRRKIVSDRVQEAMRPAIALQPTSWQPGTGGSCSVPEAKFNVATHLPSNRQGLSQSMHTMPDTRQRTLEEEN